MRTVAAVAGMIGLVAAVFAQPPAPLAPPVVAPPAPAPVPAVQKGDAASEKAVVPPPLLAAPDPALLAHIRNLGAADYRAREAAGRALEALGDKALPHLRRALAEADNPEVIRRLTVLVRKMDYDRLVNPRRVTLNAKDRTAKQLFDEVVKQTGYRIEFQGGGAVVDAKHTVAFDNAPFWQVMDALAELAGAQINASGYDDDTIQVSAFGTPTRTPFVAYAGPFKMAATNVQVNRSMPLVSGDPRGVGFVRPSESVSLVFNVFSEPKNPLLGMAIQPQVVAAEDDQGQSMAPPRDPNQPFGGIRSSYYGGGGYRSFNLSGSLGLSRGGREAKAIRSVTAKMGVNLLSAIVPEVVVADPLKAKNLKRTGRTVEVELDSVVPANGGGYSAALTLRKTGVQDPNFPDYNWSNNIWQKVELLDAAGNKYRNYGPNSMNNNPGVVTMTLPFQPTDRRGMQQKFGPPVRLVVNEWVQATHEVTFEFRDVPLP